MNRHIHTLIHTLWIVRHVTICRPFTTEGTRWTTTPVHDLNHPRVRAPYLVCTTCKVSKWRLGRWA